MLLLILLLGAPPQAPRLPQAPPAFDDTVCGLIAPVHLDAHRIAHNPPPVPKMPVRPPVPYTTEDGWRWDAREGHWWRTVSAPPPALTYTHYAPALISPSPGVINRPFVSSGVRGYSAACVGGS